MLAAAGWAHLATPFPAALAGSAMQISAVARRPSAPRAPQRQPRRQGRAFRVRAARARGARQRRRGIHHPHLRRHDDDAGAAHTPSLLRGARCPATWPRCARPAAAVLAGRAARLGCARGRRSRCADSSALGHGPCRSTWIRRPAGLWGFRELTIEAEPAVLAGQPRALPWALQLPAAPCCSLFHASCGCPASVKIFTHLTEGAYSSQGLFSTCAAL